MLRRSKVPFEYVKYVLPSEECIKEVVEEIVISKNIEKASSKLELALRVMEWIKENIKFNPEMETPELNPCVTLKTRKGACLSLSILMVSILRAIGFNESVVGVIVTLNRSEHPLKATHSSVILAEDLNNLREQDYVTILDPTKNAYVTVKLHELLATNVVIIMFNDRHSWVPLLADGPNDVDSEARQL